MSEDILTVLERQRREAVDQARLALHTARGACQRAEQALKSQQRERMRRERALSESREAFMGASTVLELRAAEVQRELCEAALREVAADLPRCQQALQDARDVVSRREELLRGAELGRRVVERKLAARAEAAGRRVELRLEDEADDALRARGR